MTRLLIAGKTRSGKSTALHRILVHALCQEWAGVIIFDGKESELHHYAGVDGVCYLGPDQVNRLAVVLQRLTDTLPCRYAALKRRGLREAAPGDLRYLIIAGEVQRATRHPEHGKTVKDALNLIAEQSAVLGGVLILSTQRLQRSIPVNTHLNCNAKLRMLGAGYFHLQVDGHVTCSGRVAYVAPGEALSTIRRKPPLENALDPEHLPTILGSQPVKPSRGPATLYVGQPGIGKTHTLLNHPNGHCPRHIYVSASQSHRKMLECLIERAGAVVSSSKTFSPLTGRHRSKPIWLRRTKGAREKPISQKVTFAKWNGRKRHFRTFREGD